MQAAGDGGACGAGGSHRAAVAATPEQLAQLHVEQDFKRNNVALKWIRDTHEAPPGKPTVACVDVTQHDPYQIGVIEKGTGMEYSFKHGQTQPWSWRQMLAALKPPARHLILGNPPLGVARLTCEPVCGSYDHKRWHAAVLAGRPYGPEVDVPVWDFFLTRSDDTCVRFHTNFTNNKVEVAEVTGRHQPIELPKPPNNGKGKSDGRGTYSRHVKGNYEQTVRSSQPDRGGGGGGGGGGGSGAAGRPRVDQAPTVPEPAEPPGALGDQSDGRGGWRSDWNWKGGNAWDGWWDWKSDSNDHGWSGWDNGSWSRWQEGHNFAGSSHDATVRWFQ